MKEKTYFTITGLIFLLIAILHLLRIIFSWQAQIGSWNVSILVSVAALIIFGYLSYEAYKLRG